MLVLYVYKFSQPFHFKTFRDEYLLVKVWFYDL